MWVRVVLVCFAVPIAIATNSFRIFGTGVLVQYWDPDKAEGFYHALGGWLIFVAALIMLFAVHRVVSLMWKSRPVALCDLAPVEEQPAGEMLMKPGWLRFGILAVLMLATAIGLQILLHGEVFPPRKSLTTFPVSLGPWTGADVPIEPDILDILGRSGEYLNRNYQTENNTQPGVWLFIAYYPSQRAGETPHSPQHCWPGSGYTPIRNDIITVSVPGHGPFPANRYVFSKGTDQVLDIYWFWAHDRGVASEYWAKYHLIKDSIKMHRSDGALIEIATDMYPGETVEAAQQRIIPFAASVVPLLNDYIPR